MGVVDGKAFTDLKARMNIICEVNGEPQSDSDLRRFLVGCNGDVDEASQQIMGYMKWLQQTPQYGMEDGVKAITQEYVQKQVDSGKAVLLSQLDSGGRPVVLVTARLHDMGAPDYDIDELCRFVVFMINSAVEVMGEDMHQACILFDLQGLSMNNMDYGLVKRLIYMLTRFYPERMGVCLLHNAPTMFSACWPIIRPWLNERTASKIKFTKGNEVFQYVPQEAFPPQFNSNATEKLSQG